MRLRRRTRSTLHRVRWQHLPRLRWPTRRPRQGPPKRLASTHRLPLTSATRFVFARCTMTSSVPDSVTTFASRRCTRRKPWRRLGPTTLRRCRGSVPRKPSVSVSTVRASSLVCSRSRRLPLRLSVRRLRSQQRTTRSRLTSPVRATRCTTCLPSSRRSLRRPSV